MNVFGVYEMEGGQKNERLVWDKFGVTKKTNSCYAKQGKKRSNYTRVKDCARCLHQSMVISFVFLLCISSFLHFLAKK